MQLQECQKCAVGTYSLGTGVAFDEWDTLPPGFVNHAVTTSAGDAPADCSKSVHASRAVLLKCFSRCLSLKKLIKLFLQLNLDTEG